MHAHVCLLCFQAPKAPKSPRIGNKRGRTLYNATRYDALEARRQQHTIILSPGPDNPTLSSDTNPTPPRHQFNAVRQLLSLFSTIVSAFLAASSSSLSPLKEMPNISQRNLKPP